MDNKKTLSVITAGVMSLAICSTLVPNSVVETSEVEAVSNMSAIEMVDDMGLGWNLGNTFDSDNIGNGSGWAEPSKPSDVETGWGNPITTKDMISTIHSYGFETVRIPVTWWQMTDSNYDINDDYLARIKEVVDWCIDEGMYAIINMHWDDSNASDYFGGGKTWLGNADNDFTNVETQYITMWNKISTYFADYDAHLVFESNNEPSISVDSLVKLNQDFVDTVRSTGGQNDDRLLLISSPETNLDKACNPSFSMPNDPANMQAVSVHYYYPPTFCVADKTSTWGYETTWGTDSDISTMVNNFEKLKSTYTDNGIPVILGEYGVLTNDAKDDASIKKFLRSVAEYSLSYEGISSILWDAGNSGDMQFFDRKNLTFFDSEIGQMYIDLSGSDIKPIELTWIEAEMETDVNDKGDTLYNVSIGSATKVKAEVNGIANAGGNGAVGYWDNNSSSWNTIIFSFSTDENGQGYINQLDEDDEVVHEGFIELPAGADTSSVQIQFYSSGYWDATAEKWVTLDVADFEIAKAYVPGVASDTDTTTTDEPTVTTTDEPTVTTDEPTETTTDEPVITTPTDLPDEPDFENLYGYIFPLFDNGVASQWENDGSLAEAIPVTGNGDYTLTINIPEDGAAESILFFALSSDLNSFQQNADEVEIFSDMTITINSILVDGEQIEHVQSPNALGTNDDGSTFRLSIYDTWSKRNIQDINPEIANTSSIVVNFTIDGILGAKDINNDTDDTTTEESAETILTEIGEVVSIDENKVEIKIDDETVTYEVSESVLSGISIGDIIEITYSTKNPNVLTSIKPVDADTTTEVTDTTTEVTDTTTEDVESDSNLKGDINCDGEVNAVDVLNVKKYVLTMLTDDDFTAQGLANADIMGGGDGIMANDLLLIKKYVLTMIDTLDNIE